MIPERRFGPDAQEFFEAVYRETPPWDIGAPQPALLALFRDYPPADPILDVGCGSGDLALHLASGGRHVVGIDLVPAAIDQAREKATERLEAGADRVEFIAEDATRPSSLGRTFGSIVDSGFLHLFDPDECDRIIPEFARVLVPGGRLYLLEFATEFPIPKSPRAITADEVRRRFTESGGWRVLSLQEAEFVNRIAPVAATAACIERV